METREVLELLRDLVTSTDSIEVYERTGGRNVTRHALDKEDLLRRIGYRLEELNTPPEPESDTGYGSIGEDEWITKNS